uniref:hypothetical protein n=1 Tax=Brachyspira aalborgi TaxID=29522 RepID=UPI00266B4D4E
NEGTTGGGDTGDNYNYNYFSVSEDWNNSKDITVISQNSSSSVYSAGTVGFSVYGATDYTISIESVTMGSGGSLTLDVSDFIYSQSTKDLRLSSSGLTKFQNASSGLTEKQKYQYTITFKIATSSESKNINVIVNLIKAKLVTKTEIENIMKSVNYKEGGLLLGGTPNAGDIIIGDGTATKFSFANATFSSSNPNFKSTGETTSLSQSASTIKASSKAFSVAYAIANTSLFKEYFGSSVFDIDYDSTLPTISGKDCTFTLKFKKLNSGYALSSEVSRLTTSGLTIKLTLDSKADWK